MPTRNHFIHASITLDCRQTIRALKSVSSLCPRCLCYQVCTFLDTTLSEIKSYMEHPACVFAEFGKVQVESIHVCEVLTVAKMKDGSVYWW